MSKDTPSNRRPLKTRSHAWAQRLSTLLVRARVSPNVISMFSIVFAAIGAALLVFLPDQPWALLMVAVMVQLRLLANMLDGMVAVEGGLKSPTGALFNEVPDRVADTLFIVALGYAIDMAWLGWFGALAAALTAYIRVLGGSLGLAHDFRGPMAKPHRMALLTASCVLGAFEQSLNGSFYTLSAAAWIIAVGSALTCFTRIRAIAGVLDNAPAQTTTDSPS